MLREKRTNSIDMYSSIEDGSDSFCCCRVVADYECVGWLVHYKSIDRSFASAS